MNFYPPGHPDAFIHDPDRPWELDGDADEGRPRCHCCGEKMQGECVEVFEELTLSMVTVCPPCSLLWVELRASFEITDGKVVRL